MPGQPKGTVHRIAMKILAQNLLSIIPIIDEPIHKNILDLLKSNGSIFKLRNTTKR
jgi:hypothetical protein